MLKEKKEKMEKKNQEMCDRQMKLAPKLCRYGFNSSEEDCARAVPAYGNKCY